MLDEFPFGAKSMPGEMRILLVHGGAEPNFMRDLECDGHDVLAVAEVGWAGRLVTVFEPDVVLVTVRDLSQACVELRERAAEVPIVAVAPDRNLDVRIAALSAGADDCLSSPFHPAELLARVRAAARRRARPVPPLRIMGEQQLGGAA